MAEPTMIPTVAAVAQAVADTAPAWTMDAAALTQVLSRWIHYVAGVLWIGHLYFFNFVNINAQGEIPAEIKKQVNPPILARALFMFRWGAMFTFISGLILLYLIHGFDFSKTGGLSTDRGLFMTMGVAFGSIMWFNVWFIIWPRQKKIIGAMQGGPAADPALPKQALLASKINTYLSVPMLMGMLAGAHGDYGFALLGGGHKGLIVAILLGFGMVWLGYKLAPKVSSKLFTPPQA